MQKAVSHPGQHSAHEREARKARVEAAEQDLRRAHGGRGDDGEDEGHVQRDVVVAEWDAQALPQARRVPVQTSRRPG